MNDRAPRHQALSRRRDIAVAGACGVFVGAMVGASYAAVPLYDWFCRATGFNGTTQVANVRARTRCSTARSPCASTPMSAPACPGVSRRRRIRSRRKLGEVITVDYIVTNLAARETLGVAAYNVAPLNYGAYFQKINCFCFNEQTHESRRDPRT